MSKGLKIWLWIIFIGNIISCVLGVFSILSSPLWGTLGLACSIVFTVGIGIILFRQRRLGFYLMCAGQVAGFVMNLFIGNGFFASLISAVLVLLITWLFMRKDWPHFRA